MGIYLVLTKEEVEQSIYRQKTGYHLRLQLRHKEQHGKDDDYCAALTKFAYRHTSCLSLERKRKKSIHYNEWEF